MILDGEKDTIAYYISIIHFINNITNTQYGPSCGKTENINLKMMISRPHKVMEINKILEKLCIVNFCSEYIFYAHFIS